MRFAGSCEKNSIKRTVSFFIAKLGGSTAPRARDRNLQCGNARAVAYGT